MRPELAQPVTKTKEKNLKIKCCYVTDQKVGHEDDLVEIMDGERIVQRLWDRIKNEQLEKNRQSN